MINSKIIRFTLITFLTTILFSACSFVQWNKGFDSLTQDITVPCTFYSDSTHAKAVVKYYVLGGRYNLPSINDPAMMEELGHAGYLPVGWTLETADVDPDTYTKDTNGHIESFLVSENEYAFYADGWDAGPVDYTVKIYLENADDDNFTLKGSELKSGTVGASVSVTPEDIENYITPSSASITLDADSSINIVELRYLRKKVSAIFMDDDSASAAVHHTIEQKFGSRIIYEPSFTTPEKTGYKFNGWYKASSVEEFINATDQQKNLMKITGNPVLMETCDCYYFPQWIADSATPYTVILHYEDIDDSSYDIDVMSETLNFSGETGTYTNYTAPEKTGFAAAPFDQVEIKADGTSELHVYYKRLTYTVTLSSVNSELLGSESIFAGGLYSGKYMQSIDYSPVSSAGNISNQVHYELQGWKKSSDNNVYNTLPSTYTENSTFTPIYKEQWIVTVDFNGGTADSSEYVSVASGKGILYIDNNGTLSLSAPEKSGYVFDNWFDSEGNIVTDITQSMEIKAVYSAATVDFDGITITFPDSSDFDTTELAIIHSTDSGTGKIIFTASGVTDITSYKWILNGEVKSSASIYEISADSISSGSYTLLLLVEADGKQYTAGMLFTVSKIITAGGGA